MHDENFAISGTTTNRTTGKRLGQPPQHLRQPLTELRGATKTPESGPHTRYRSLGAHLEMVNGVAGTRFAVWAPNASEVSVLCDANDWSHGVHQLHGSDSGIWSGFIPELRHGDIYKYSVKTRWGQLLEKADPYAFACEHPPKSASIIYNLSGYRWLDGEWMTHRSETDWHQQPVSIYEVHLGSWKRPTDGRRYYNYRELAHMLVEYAQELGYTHLQLMPISEFPFDGSWGYQATGYFAPTSRYGSPHDFMYFVDYCHRAGIGVFIDWVPAHFPNDAHALARFDGTALYEHADPRKGFHPDWGTYIFNYGRDEVREFLLSSAHFWMETYHVDGLRVDAVASMLYLDYSRKEGEWIPNQHGGRENLEAIQFLKEMNIDVHGAFPGILTIAEESTAWGGVSQPVYNGGLGFSMKWDMGWMNDTLRYIRREPVHRSFHQNELSFRMMYAFSENFVMPLSHDEVVHGKQALISQMPGDAWQKFANLRMLYGYQYAMPGKKLLFMGGELGQWTEWNHDAEIDWALEGHHFHDGLQRYVADLNRLYSAEPALYELDFQPEGFRWIQADDWQNSTYVFYRMARDPEDLIVAAFNFTPVPRKNYRMGVPRPGIYQEVLNSDAAIYAGGDISNSKALGSKRVKCHGLEQSIVVTLPPLGVVMFKPE